MGRKLRILAQSAATLRLDSGLVRVATAAALMLAGMIGAFGLAPNTTLEPVPTERIVRDLEPPAIVASTIDGGYWREEPVRRGDTLGSVLARLGVDDPRAQNFLRAEATVRSLDALRPGRSLRTLTDGEGHLIALRSTGPAGDTFNVDRVESDGQRFVASTGSAEATVGTEVRANEIEASLFEAADAVGVPDSVTSQLAEIFGGDIDFQHDLRRGDRFTIVYETRRIAGAFESAGKILAAEFVNSGKAYRAFLWNAPDGGDGYYDEAGRSLRKAFLRSPLGFRRVTSGFSLVSSGFSLARFQPFLQAWHAHKGVDFAAPTGTPVHAAGTGKVIVAGQQTGYGNVVMLQHGATYTTVYAHLSRFAPGVRSGAHVAQGAVIGYVGQTGWATGPHLHYELRVDNVQKNPLTVALPNAKPVPLSERAQYAARVSPLAEELNLSDGIVLAGGE